MTVFDACEKLTQKLENERVQSELAMLRAVNELHREYQQSLKMEKDRSDREHKQKDRWISDLKESFQKEREMLLQKISALESSRQLITRDGGTEGNGDLMAKERRSGMLWNRQEYNIVNTLQIVWKGRVPEI